MAIDYLLGEEIVNSLAGYSCQSYEEFVKISRCVRLLRFEKMLT